MKKTGILKAMKLCRDYDRMSEGKRDEVREKRLRDLVAYVKEHSPYYKELYKNI